jgi:hypothetical protein
VNSRNYDDDLAAFLELKDVNYVPKVTKPSPQNNIDNLIQMISQATFGSDYAGSKRVNSPATTHDEQKMQLTADLRLGKSSISFPILPVGLRLNGY